MKNAAKKLCLTVGGIIMGSIGQLNADILPISPENGSTVSLHNARQKAFLTMSQQERKANFSDQTFRDSLHASSWYPVPVVIRWMVSKKTAGPYTVTLYEGRQRKAVDTAVVNDLEVKFDNLKIATAYRYTVQAASGEKYTGFFNTSDQPPRLMCVENVPNFRDFGGRIGLDGRRIRQGMLYRSAGLNDNATPVNEFSQEKLSSEGGWRQKFFDIYTADLEKLRLVADSEIVPWKPCGNWQICYTAGKVNSESVLEFIKNGIPSGSKFEATAGDQEKIIVKSPAVRRMIILKREFEASADGYHTVSCNGDWFWAMFVNGRIIFDCRDGSEGQPGHDNDNFVFDIPVKKGRNEIVVLLGSGLNSWQWYFHDQNGVPAEKRLECMKKRLEKHIRDLSIVTARFIPGKSRVDGASGEYLRNKLKIKSDIDLRNDTECHGMTGSPLGDTVKWYHYSSQAYSMIPNGKKPFAKVFKVLLEKKNYPAVFHCISGQDRTGCLAFTLQALLGVEENLLFLDWETTGFWNPESRISHRRFIDVYASHLAKLPGCNWREKSEYYVKSCGFTDKDIAKFRSIMLEDK